jgi:predicted pyridoxine 5'-phosphate oxidase superfamily flavin-nucleotide-binding protein
MTRLEKLKDELAPPSERATAKVVNFMSGEIQEFISKSPFAVVSTSNAGGDCDSSPKGGQPGFIKVLDKQSLLIPDINGNRLFQGFANIQSNPKIVLLFMIPGINKTARVNGRVTELDSNEVRAHGVDVEIFNSVSNSALIQGLIVHVDEAYLHCPRALRFSELWNIDTIKSNQSV